MHEWKEAIVKKINVLLNRREKIVELERKLRWDNQITESDSEDFTIVLEIIDQQVETLRFELILDDMLESDLPLDEFLKKFNDGH